MTQQYPMERVLFNVHSQMCTSALRRTSNRTRSMGEYILLILAVCGFGMLLLLHISFVHSGGKTRLESNLRSIPLTCLSSINGFSKEADITHVSLTDSGDSFAFFKNSNTCSEKTQRSAKTCTLQDVSEEEVLLSQSYVKGYLLLPPTIAEANGLRVQHVVVSRSDSRCFGEPFLQSLVFAFTGPDTVILNWVLAAYEGRGFVFHPGTGLLQELNEQESFLRSLELNGASNFGRRDSHLSWDKQILAKIGVVVKTSFLYFITSTLVSFTLRETQERMLDFAHQLQARVRSRRPVLNLVTTHLADSLVFCPVMVGMIFFLIEFYSGDKAMAFIVLSVVWLCEVFSIISLRSWQGVSFFPKIFFLLFSLLHFYTFSFPFGFRQTALASTVCFMAHSMLFFWHRFELPAVALGHVTLEHPRAEVMPPTTPPRFENSQRVGVTPPQTSDTDPLRRAIGVPSVQLQPRNNLIIQHSQSTHSSITSTNGRASGNPSTSLLDESSGNGEDGSLMFFMNGEVVMERPHTPTSIVGSVSVASSLRDIAVDSLSPNGERNSSRSSPLEEASDQQPGTLQVIMDVNSNSVVSATPRRGNLSFTCDSHVARDEGPTLPRSLDEQDMLTHRE